MLPPALVAATDFSTLRVCGGSYVDELLAGSSSDLLFTANVASKPAYYYVLFEHQSDPDELMPFRLLRYIVRILARHVANAKTPAAAPPLPLVISVVLHHGEKGWTVARRLEELFDPDGRAVKLRVSGRQRPESAARMSGGESTASIAVTSRFRDNHSGK